MKKTASAVFFAVLRHGVAQKWIYSGIKFKSGQGDEAADSTGSTARRGNAVLV
ncbi:hypothetical protein [Neisseria sp. HMSC70E02]|uniref:hypothetical protein n=1 Tax=Neisseria sp. HMSC70E02 TaxID=1608896 RepID=UPI00143B4022|nr:hypothetical protein [Neisseria sp. HMSC70E02]